MTIPKDLSVVISNLNKAKIFISDPKNWAKGDYLFGDVSDANYRACAMGALECVGVEKPQCRIAARLFDPYYEVPLEHSYMFEAAMSLNSEFNSYIEFNDDPRTTHAAIMRLFNRAIYLAKADAQIDIEQAVECIIEERAEALSRC